jgi:hypothetical protein
VFKIVYYSHRDGLDGLEFEYSWRDKESNVYPWVTGRTLQWDGFALRTFGLPLSQFYKAAIQTQGSVATVALGR